MYVYNWTGILFYYFFEKEIENKNRTNCVIWQTNWKGKIAILSFFSFLVSFAAGRKDRESIKI